MALDKATCETLIAEARAALHQLQMGKVVVEVRNENTMTRYSAANKGDLAQYIARLEAECSCFLGTNRRRPLGVRF